MTALCGILRTYPPSQVARYILPRPTHPRLCVPLQEESIPVCDTSPAKKTQLIIGVNAVTRLLEGGTLEAGLLCSSSPRVLCQHVLPLAATRGVPFAAVPDLSSEVARLLGIKRVMCLGLKVNN